MTIIATFSNDLPQHKRFVRKSLWKPGKYEYCIQSSQRAYDAEQGYCDAEDLPSDVRDAADNYQGCFYACEWPLNHLVTL